MNFKKTQMAVAVASVMSLVVGNVAFAQAAATAERVTVTGSNIKRAAKEGSSPIEVITAKDIQQSGAKSVLELLKTVSALGTDVSTTILRKTVFRVAWRPRPFAPSVLQGL